MHPIANHTESFKLERHGYGTTFPAGSTPDSELPLAVTVTRIDSEEALPLAELPTKAPLSEARHLCGRSSVTALALVACTVLLALSRSSQISESESRGRGAPDGSLWSPRASSSGCWVSKCHPPSL